MSSSRLDIGGLRQTAIEAVGVDNKINRQVNEMAKQIFEDIKKETLEEYNNDPVTKEIEAGPQATTTLLPGGYGNLFSFIGFDANSKPTEELRDELSREIRFATVPQKIPKSNQVIRYQFAVFVPTLKLLESHAPLPYFSVGGKSWISAIEKGFDNLHSYINKFYEKSRSLFGVQAKNKATGQPITIRNVSFQPQPYISKILNNLQEKLK